VNGVVLNEVSGEAIARVLLEFLRTPDLLSAMSANSGVGDRFSLTSLAWSLRNL
jgi:hypothetical protein